ncbi:MAG: STAS domain-containing protein [Candidatus Methylomirabilia bacterium]
MELVNHLRDHANGEIVLEFSEVEAFEAFGVEVLLRHLGGAGRADTRVRCCGLPPSLAQRMQEAGVAVAPSARHPRWTR